MEHTALFSVFQQIVGVYSMWPKTFWKMSADDKTMLFCMKV